MLTLHNPWMLAALAVIPLLIWYFRKRRRPTVVISTVAPARKVSRPRRLQVPEVIYLAALALLILALARPRSPLGRVMERRQGLDIVLAIDLSGSMQAIDRPANLPGEKFIQALNAGKVPNRLEAAKAEIRRFIAERPNDRIGLVGFADLAYSFVPPTLDHNLLLERLNSLEIGEIGEQTGIASPIGTAVEKLKRSTAPRRVLVLFTDGANTAENQLTPRAAAELAKEFNVIIHTVGIGGNDAYAVVSTPFGSRLAPVQGEYDAELLHDLAKITGGTTFHAADAGGLKRVMAQINAMEKTNIEQPKPVNYREYAPGIALAALALFFSALVWKCWRITLP